MTGPADDPSDRPTRMADYSALGSLPPSADDPDSVEPDAAPDPWYRNRVLLGLWATMVALLIALIIYGLVQLSHGSQGGGESTTTPTRSSTTSPTTTTPSTTTAPSATPEQTPEEAPPPPSGNDSPAPTEPPRHHHHHLHLPHLPPGF